MFHHYTVNQRLLPNLTSKRLKHPHHRRMLNVLLVHDPVQQLQFVTLVVEALLLISLKHLDSELVICLHLYNLKQPN